MTTTQSVEQHTQQQQQQQQAESDADTVDGAENGSVLLPATNADPTRSIGPLGTVLDVQDVADDVAKPTDSVSEPADDVPEPADDVAKQADNAAEPANGGALTRDAGSDDDVSAGSLGCDSVPEPADDVPEPADDVAKQADNAAEPAHGGALTGDAGSDDDVSAGSLGCVGGGVDILSEIGDMQGPDWLRKYTAELMKVPGPTELTEIIRNLALLDMHLGFPSGQVSGSVTCRIQN